MNLLKYSWNRAVAVCFVACMVAFSGGLVFAQDIPIDRPGDRQFVLDLASMIAPEDRTQIKEVCDATLTDKAIPIVVVTIDSMGTYVGGTMRIETFAMLLFNQWGIGNEKLGDEYWNKGILLLVSRDDRVARIELGDGWGHEQDGLARQVMDEQIISRFKKGDFSGGIVGGVLALEKLARGEELPSPPINWMSVALVIGFIGLAIFTVISLIRRGASGWAWLFWAALFGLVGWFLLNMLRNSASGGGGGFSGGSFGGGFSGGGGATGSW